MSSQIIINPDDFDQQFIPELMAASSLPANVGGYIEDLIDTTEIVIGNIIIDSTGSMKYVREAVVDGYARMHNFLKATSERRKFQVARTMFNNNIWEAHSFLPVINEFEPDRAFPVMPLDEYTPGGLTKVFDAFLWGAASCEYYMKAVQKSKQATVTRIVQQLVTDGFDNMSKDGSQAKIIEFVKKRKTSELWSFQLFGIADPDLVKYVAQELGITYSTLDTDEKLELADRMFKAFACGNDAEMEAIIAEFSNFEAGIGGLGFKPEWVMTERANAESVAETFGTKMSSSFVAGSNGLFTANSGSLQHAVTVPVDVDSDANENKDQGVF